MTLVMTILHSFAKPAFDAATDAKDPALTIRPRIIVFSR
ncbi:hypothetical protein CCACVL1_22685 [Corchorus capsularis]|uniref:Uncharacterized protein n=1 Tax=Corchorus capsularis TaxID=210143 RepID=A0A1R3GX80_COCAP|nr:hypothetical protein CCACVL1_22685 [Corchorus capsularis]